MAKLAEDLYNVEKFSDFFVKYDCSPYRVDSNNRIYRKHDDGRYYPCFDDTENPEYNLNWAKAKIWGLILKFDSDYKNMKPRQKVEIVEAIIQKIRFNEEEEKELL